MHGVWPRFLFLFLAFTRVGMLAMRCDVRTSFNIVEGVFRELNA